MSEPTERARRWRRWILEGIVLVAIVLAVRGWQSRGLPSGDAPTAALVDLSGASIALRDVPRPVVVHFMASWCGVCSAEEGSIAALARDHEVIAIASGSGDAREVGAWLRTTELAALRTVADPDARLATAWGVSAFPTTFYLDRTGAIRHVEVGYTTELGMRLRAWLAGR